LRETFCSMPRCFALLSMTGVLRCFAQFTLERSEGLSRPGVILRRSRRIWLANEIALTMQSMSTPKQYYVYIMTNKSGTLYVGVTNDVKKRVYQHKSKQVEGFTKKYNIDKLLYFETFGDVYSAIGREKSIKGWLRKKKLDLIKTSNRDWIDISQDWYE